MTEQCESTDEFGINLFWKRSLSYAQEGAKTFS